MKCECKSNYCTVNSKNIQSNSRNLLHFSYPWIHCSQANFNNKRYAYYSYKRIHKLYFRQYRWANWIKKRHEKLPSFQKLKSMNEAETPKHVNFSFYVKEAFAETLKFFGTFHQNGTRRNNSGSKQHYFLFVFHTFRECWRCFFSNSVLIQRNHSLVNGLLTFRCTLIPISFDCLQ